MIEAKLDAGTRRQAREESKELGSLKWSLTHGLGNYVGCAGEIIAHKIIGGTRVGHLRFSHDIELPNGMRVDVKSGKAKSRPLPHYVARIYAAENQREELATKCDAYYFMRVHEDKHTVWALGWILAEEFAEKAVFHPRGSRHLSDGREVQSDEFTVPISLLRNPRDPITR
jgi:hypothetical protein